MDDSRPGGGRHEPTTLAREEDAAAAAAASGDEDESDGEFEFPFVSRDAAAAGSGAAPADELFAGGRIRTFYPVFGRILPNDAASEPEPARAPLGRLFQLEKAQRTSSVASTSSSSTSSSSAAGMDLDGASPDSYCLWTPGSASPARPPRKSGSTGSMARWRRIGELVVGRSHSDGREKFLFLSAPPSPSRDRAPKAKAKPPQQGRGSSKAKADAGRRMSYGAAAKGSSPGARRTFLPYRQDLMGLFANVNGLSRSHQHPF